MFNKIRQKWMAFKDIFKDTNDYNEKTVVGFMSFAIMVFFAVANLGLGMFGKNLVINEYVYNSFVIVTLGAFGIAEVGKIFGKKEKPSIPPKFDEEI